jgi:hypothetical protein
MRTALRLSHSAHLICSDLPDVMRITLRRNAPEI